MSISTSPDPPLRELRTRLSVEDCRRRIAARLLPTDQRFALQHRWRPPPRDLVVTGTVDPTGFVLRKTLPVYAREPALWGQFEAIPAGTRIRMWLVSSGSKWILTFRESDLPSSGVRRLIWKASVWLTLGVIASASVFELWRAPEHEGFLVGFLREVLEAEEILDGQ